MAAKTFTMTIGGDKLIGKRAIANPDDLDNPMKAACPACKQLRRKRRPLGDFTQYGFTWDFHVTMFRCSCGQIFFHEYKIWHNESEAV